MQQLRQNQELLRQEEEMKLKRQILEAQYEVQQADLQMKMLEQEDAVFNYSPTVPAEFKPYTEELNDGYGVAYKPEDSVPQVEWKPRPYTPSQTRLNSYAKESTSSSVSGPSTIVGKKDSVLSEDVLDRIASTIKQGFALPKPELSIFDGNPLEYWNFIKSFETSIERNAVNESEKHMYLPQYTSGEAKKTIKSCLVMDSSVGYQTARKLLEERFGHPFTIASMYVAKLTEGPPLKASDRVGLLAFADQLKDCERTLESIGYLDEISSADNLRRIVQRLPFLLRTKFVEVADSIQQSGKRTSVILQNSSK